MVSGSHWDMPPCTYRDKGVKERVTSSSCSSLVSLGQSETHSAGGLRKHEDGGRLHSKARASGLQPRKRRASAGGGARKGERREETVRRRRGETEKGNDVEGCEF